MLLRREDQYGSVTVVTLRNFVSFRQVCTMEECLRLAPTSWPSTGMLDVFGQQVIHFIANAIAKVVTNFPHTAESGDQAIAAIGR